MAYMFEYLGLSSMLLAWICLGIMLHKWPNAGNKTISEHVTVHRRAHAVFAFGLGVGGVLIYWWAVDWLAPQLGLGSWFIALTGIAIALQMIVAVVPADRRRAGKVHTIAAFTMAALYVPVSWLIVVSPGISDVARMICVVLFVAMVGMSLYGSATWRRRSRVVAVQAVYVVTFQVLLLAAAYL